MWAERIDAAGKPAWLALTVVAFLFWWPLGLAALVFLCASGRFRAWRLARHEGGEGWCGPWAFGCAAPSGGPGQGGPFSGTSANWKRWTQGGSSGNAAFDAYRHETLRRLEEEQREFQDYLQRLRRARDKQEFDQFMADRRNRNSGDIVEHPDSN